MNNNSLVRIISLIVPAVFTLGASAQIECTPGNLHLLVSNPASTTSLTLAGSVNAADLFYIDSDMPALTSLDLSAVNIEAYDGAVLQGYRHYAAATIPARTFAGKGITNLVLPRQDVTIGDMAFAGTDIRTISITDNITLGSGVFAACNSLESAEIYGSDTGTYTFKACSKLERANLHTCTVIDTAAFADCPALTAVTAMQVQTIAPRAFEGCTALESFSFPATLTAIEEQAFASGGLKTADLQACTHLSDIGPWSFAHCASLQSVVLPQTLATLGEGCFFDCTSLADITCGSTITAIPAYAFKGADLDGSVNPIGEGVETIGDYAMSGTHSSTLTLPGTLRHIGNNAMEAMTNLSSMDATALHTVPALGDDVWNGVDTQSVELYVAPGMDGEFLLTPQWQDFKIKGYSSQQESDEIAQVKISARRIGNILELKVTGTEFAAIGIYGAGGQMLLEMPCDSDNVSIDINAIPAGVMIVRCTLADGSVTILKLA